MTRSFEIAGFKVRTSSSRRFVAWVVRRDGTVAPEIFKRSDSIEALRTQVRRRGIRPGSYVVIVNTDTGEEVRG